MKKTLVIATLIAASIIGCADKNDIEEIKCYTKEGVEKIVKYDEYELEWLEQKGVPKEALSNIDYRLLKDKNDYAIKNIYDVDPDFSEANKYDERFDIEDVSTLLLSGYYSENVRKIPKNIAPTANIVREILTSKVPVNKIELYEGYDVSDVIDNIKANFIWEYANNFDERFKKGNRALDLHKLDITYVKANSYNDRFDGFDVLRLVKNGIDHETANAFHKNAGVDDVIKLFVNKKNVKIANKYYELGEKYGVDFRWGEVYGFMEKNISLSMLDNTMKKAKRESEIAFRFGGFKNNLEEKGISLTRANKYHENFSAKDIIYFVENKKSPSQVNKYVVLEKKYDHDFEPEEINKLINNKTPFSVTENKLKEDYTAKTLDRYF